jgi:hypothetical protein
MIHDTRSKIIKLYVMITFVLNLDISIIILQVNVVTTIITLESSE